MKKIFFSILICISNISTTSDQKNKISFSVTAGYAKYASFESFCNLIPQLIHWKNSDSKKYILETVNTENTKELEIKFLEERKERPVTLLFFVHNTNQDPNFITSSIWDHAERLTTNQDQKNNTNTLASDDINEIFNREKQTCTSMKEKDLEDLRTILHCKDNKIGYFLTQIKTYTKPKLTKTAKQIRERDDQLDEEETYDNTQPKIYTYQGLKTSPFSSVSRSPSPEAKKPETAVHSRNYQANNDF